MPVCRVNDGTAWADDTSVRATTATIANATKRRIVWPPSNRIDMLLRTLPFTAGTTSYFATLLRDVVKERLHFIVFQPEIRHAGVVVLGEQRFGERIRLEHHRGIFHPAAEPTKVTKLRHADQIGARALALPDRMTPCTPATAPQRLATLGHRRVRLETARPRRSSRVLCRQRTSPQHQEAR